MEERALAFAEAAHAGQVRKYTGVYLEEKRLLLEVLTEGDPTLYALAVRMAQDRH